MIGRLKRGWFTLFALAAALSVTLSNCGAPTQNAVSPGTNPGGSPAVQSDARTLVFGSVGDPVTLESGNVIDGYSIAVQQQIYDRLLDTKPGTTELVPALATEYSASPDGRTWTFKLRQAELSSIGIRVKLNTKDWAAYLADRFKSPGYQAFMLGWTGDYGDPDNFFYPHFGKGSIADIGNWKNDRVFTLLSQARSTPDPAERAKMYAEVDRILFEEAVRIPMVHAELLLAQRSNLSGWTPSPFGSDSFAAITKQ